MITYEPTANISVEDACSHAVLLARLNNENVEFYFDGIKMTATKSDYGRPLAQSYWRKKNPPQASNPASRQPYADSP